MHGKEADDRVEEHTRDRGRIDEQQRLDDLREEAVEEEEQEEEPNRLVEVLRPQLGGRLRAPGRHHLVRRRRDVGLAPVLPGMAARCWGNRDRLVAEYGRGAGQVPRRPGAGPYQPPVAGPISRCTSCATRCGSTGLARMPVRAGVARDGVQVARDGGGEEQHGDRLRRRVGAQCPADVEPIDPGHRDVEQHQVGQQLTGAADAALAVARLLDLVAEVPEHRLLDLALVGLVVDHQDAAWPAGHRRRPHRRGAPRRPGSIVVIVVERVELRGLLLEQLRELRSPRRARACGGRAGSARRPRPSPARRRARSRRAGRAASRPRRDSSSARRSGPRGRSGAHWGSGLRRGRRRTRSSRRPGRRDRRSAGRRWRLILESVAPVGGTGVADRSGDVSEHSAVPGARCGRNRAAGSIARRPASLPARAPAPDRCIRPELPAAAGAGGHHIDDERSA
jgi:hypothetical protein